MSLQPLIAWIVAPLMASALAMTYAAANNLRALYTISALAFVLAVLTVAWLVNRPLWSGIAGQQSVVLFHTMRRNTRITALMYAWAATALLAVYGFSGIAWLHGPQYGLGCALIAGGLLAYVHWLGKSGGHKPPPISLTYLHLIAVAVGLCYLVFSGKLATNRADWAANIVFLVGGIAQLVIGWMALRSYRGAASGVPVTAQR